MDYYSILGVNKTSTQDEIKKAYRKLASKHHPDRGGDEALFKQVQEAYDVLGDVDKRNQYDNPQRQFGFNFEDIFSQAGQHFRPNARSPDTVINLEISMEQMISGGDLQVDLGYTQEVITIPPGIRDGSRIRLKDKGRKRHPNLPPGDLLISIVVRYPENMARDGDDIYQNIAVNSLIAASGGEVSTRIYNNKTLKVKIPKGAQHGEKLRLSKFGIHNTQSNRIGNLYLIINLYTPVITDQDHIKMLNSIISEI